MSRLPRNYIKTSFFHIITQGINKNYIFEKSEDIKFYIKTMYKLTQEHKIKIIAYCIMNNHAHILIKTEHLSELSKYMQRLNTKYGKYYNIKYNRIGYVFRDRFKSEGIFSEEHLYNCIKYIYNNPVKAGICSSPEQYPYSNYKNIDKFTTNNYIFLDVDQNKDELCNNIVNKFLTQNNYDLTDLKNDRKKLKELVISLKEQYKISLRQISDNIGISRETIRRIYHQ